MPVMPYASKYNFFGGGTPGTLPSSPNVPPIGGLPPAPTPNWGGWSSVGGGGGGMGLGSLGSFFSTPGGAATGAGIGSFLSNLFNSGHQNKMDQLMMQLNQERLQLDKEQAQQGQENWTKQFGQSQAKDYMSTMSMDPLYQQKQIFKGGAIAALAGSGAPYISPGGGGMVQNQPDFSGAAQTYLNPTALSDALNYFYQNAANLNPNATPPNLAGMGGNRMRATAQRGAGGGQRGNDYFDRPGY